LDAIPEDWARLVEVFARHGIDGTEQTDRPPSLCGYLPEEAHELVGPLGDELRAYGATEVAVDSVPEEDWAEGWKQFFVTRRIGRRFVLRPSWAEPWTGEGDLVIELDPGQAFGTGDHPTTRMCLELLEEIAAPKRVADIGCGSGVLAIAAARLGAEVQAVDVDPLSVEITCQNAARNGVYLQAFEGRGFDPLPAGRSYDLVMSNIISAALISLAPEAWSRLMPGGSWIVSGVIEANWPDVLAAAERCGFRLAARREEGDWVAATFSR
jgi:ribosomal protein L11 methyltransferase